ncbi:somatostatin receptor type 2-like [Oculina patagonica]
MNNTDPDVFHLFKGVPWIVVYTCEAVLILTGNSITVYIFWSIRKRLKRTSYLLINLAVADFLVGIAITLFLSLHITTAMTLQHVNYVEKTAVFVDTVGVVSSILSLALISLERMLAILWPFRHRTMNTWYYHICVGIVWFLASLIATVNVTIDVYLTERDYGLNFVMAITIICAVLIIIGAYLAIWISTKRSQFPNNTCRSMEQNRKLAKTLFIVTAFSVITCLPAGIIIALRVYLQHMHSFRVQITFAAQYANSFLNPVIYCFRMPEFKNSLKKLLCSCPRQRLSFNDNSSEAASGVTLRSMKNIEIR